VIRAPHAKYVLDASVAAKWFTRHDEADRHTAVSLRSLHQSGRCTLVVPDFSLLEIVNAVRYSERAEEEDAAQALRLLERLRLDIVRLDWKLIRQATAVAWEYRVAVYDAVYVALAEREGFPLLTADDVMVKKMKGHSLIVPLRDMELAQ